MNNRWQMNRIGFVNFWLYDNEVFDLGKWKNFNKEEQTVQENQ